MFRSKILFILGVTLLMSMPANTSATPPYTSTIQRVEPPGSNGRNCKASVFATWQVESTGDAGPQPLLLAADGGVPIAGARYWCYASANGFWAQGVQPHSLSGNAGFAALVITPEVFANDPNDAGAAYPQVRGEGISAATTYSCCLVNP